jgi:hypothetical protein
VSETSVGTDACRYSTKNYRSLLDAAQRSGYRFSSFLDRGEAEGRRIYLRHDVDFSLSGAVDLARINASVGVAGTFFVLLRSELYNLLSPWSLDRVRELQALGQHVGLHYAPPVISIDGIALTRSIASDYGMLLAEVPGVDAVFSWHNPSRQLIEDGLKLDVPGLVNVYGPPFLESAQYYSDSNMRNSVARFQEVLEAGVTPALHLLLHPVSWVAGGASVMEILAGAWKYVLRDREYGMRTNSLYHATFPAGMPQQILEDFAQQWLEEARNAQVSP